MDITGLYTHADGYNVMIGSMRNGYYVSYQGTEKDPRPRWFYRTRKWVERQIKNGTLTKV